MVNAGRKNNKELFSNKESTMLMWGIFVACSVVSANVVVAKIDAVAQENESFYHISTVHAETMVPPAV